MARVFNMQHCGDMGVGMDTEQESAHKVNSGEENFPTTPVGIQTGKLLIMSLALLPTSSPIPSVLITLYLFQVKQGQTWRVSLVTEI